MSNEERELHVTPLVERHRALGAKLIDFAGWLMPVQYSGILEEHRVVREKAGLFDLSHMGEIYLEGPDAEAALDAAVVSHPGRLTVGRAQYSIICDADGGIIDDLLIYRTGEQQFLVVPNASNARVVSDTLAERVAGKKVILDDRSYATALVAIQGPLAAEILQGLTTTSIAGVRTYSITETVVGGVPCQLARTGYTGEDGFELFVDATRAVELWDLLLAAGEPSGVMPCGLGARDTLRLEAGMPLYGNELGRDTNPIEAGLGWAVKLDNGDFTGKQPIERTIANGPTKKLVGLIGRERGIARHGYEIWAGDRKTGVVTSGTHSPTLGVAIAMGYVEPDDAVEGTMLGVAVRDQRVAFEVVPLPFYRRNRKG